MDFGKELEQRVKEAMEAVPEVVASTAKRYFLERFSEKSFDGEPWPPWSKKIQARKGGRRLYRAEPCARAST